MVPEGGDGGKRSEMVFLGAGLRDGVEGFKGGGAKRDVCFWLVVLFRLD